MRTARWARFAVPVVMLLLVTGACAGSSDGGSDGGSGAGSGAGSSPAAAGSMVGSPAPATSGPSLTGDGTLELSSMTGKPTVVAFWLYACPHCKEFIPAFQDAWLEAAPNANVLTVGMEYDDPSEIDAPEGYDSPEAFVESTGLTLPTLASTWATEAEAWGLQGVPAVFVLGADHTIAAVFEGGDVDPSDILDVVAECGACEPGATG